MRIIFPGSPFNNGPDHAFEREFEAAKSVGFKTVCIGPELYFGEVPKPAIDHDRIVLDERNLFRGWILSLDRYKNLNSVYNLYTTPEAYQYSYYFPEWYKVIGKQYTPASIWFDGFPDDKEVGIDYVSLLVKSLGYKAAIVKDFIKSQKHDWYDSCFIRDATDTNEIKRVLTNFINASMEIVGGIVIREYIDFKKIGIHSKSKLPLINEYRLFVLNGKVIATYPYWAEGNYGDKPDKAVYEVYVAPWIKEIKSPFFAADIAQKEDGGWMLIEINDGGTAGLPEHVDAVEFYQALKDNL